LTVFHCSLKFPLKLHAVGSLVSSSLALHSSSAENLLYIVFLKDRVGGQNQALRMRLRYEHAVEGTRTQEQEEHRRRPSFRNSPLSDYHAS